VITIIHGITSNESYSGKKIKFSEESVGSTPTRGTMQRKRKTKKYSSAMNMTRFNYLLSLPHLWDDEVEEIRELSAELGIKIKLKRLNLNDDTPAWETLY